MAQSAWLISIATTTLLIIAQVDGQGIEYLVDLLRLGTNFVLSYSLYIINMQIVLHCPCME